MRQNITSGTRWEPLAGYSRAVKVGEHLHISGTTATDRDGNIVGEGDAEAQTRQIFENLGWALEQAGVGFEQVVRTRIYITRAEDWEGVAKLHGEVFADIRPATTLVVVAALIDPALLVEIEADAYLGEG